MNEIISNNLSNNNIGIHIPYIGYSFENNYFYNNKITTDNEILTLGFEFFYYYLIFYSLIIPDLIE